MLSHTRFRWIAFAGLLLSFAVSAAEPLEWEQVENLPSPPPGEVIRYGSAPQQFGELRLPVGKGPFPVMILIHGGCWLAGFDAGYMAHLSDWLSRQGVATWTIEYRRIGDDGGGWPGTLSDVGKAADALRGIGMSASIDLQRVYSGGHSSGGQLALWLAARKNLPPTSPLFVRMPIIIRGVLALSAITDLQTYGEGPPGSCHAAVDNLMGGTPKTALDHYKQVSPISLLPLGVPQVFLQGDHDPTVDPASVASYVDKAKAAGDDATIFVLRSAGHFETVIPQGDRQAILARALKRLLR